MSTSFVAVSTVWAVGFAVLAYFSAQSIVGSSIALPLAVGILVTTEIVFIRVTPTDITR